MSFVVPFDGSSLAGAALRRATSLADLVDTRVVAVSVVPQNAAYARERGWIGPDEPFSASAIVDRLREQVGDVAPDAEFRHVTVDKYARSGTIAKAIRRLAVEERASVVFVGSDDAGHLVTSIASVGANVAADSRYDVHIVRSPAGGRFREDVGP